MVLEEFLPFLQGKVFGIALEKWFIALVILVAAFLAGKTLYYFFKSWGKRITQKTSNKFDDMVLDMVEEPVVLMVLIAGLVFAFQVLGVQDQWIVGAFNNMIYLLVVLAITWFVVRFIDGFLENFIEPMTSKTKSQFDDQIVPLAKKGLKGVVLVMAGMIVLDNFGFDITALIAGLGIGGLALAFAAKETISNVFGGISLILDKSYKVGDKVKLESGDLGVVMDIGLRSTRIKTYNNEVVIIPNARMANSKIINYAQPSLKIRGNVPFGVVYGAKVDQVRKVVTNELKKMEFVLEDPEPAVHFIEMGDFALKFIAFFWVENYSKAWVTERVATERVYNALNKAKIGIPFPTQTVYVKK